MAHFSADLCAVVERLQAVLSENVVNLIHNCVMNELELGMTCLCLRRKAFCRSLFSVSALLGPSCSLILLKSEPPTTPTETAERSESKKVFISLLAAYDEINENVTR